MADPVVSPDPIEQIAAELLAFAKHDDRPDALVRAITTALRAAEQRGREAGRAETEARIKALEDNRNAWALLAEQTQVKLTEAQLQIGTGRAEARQPVAVTPLITKLRKVSTCVYLAADEGPARDISETCIAAVNKLAEAQQQIEHVERDYQAVLRVARRHENTIRDKQQQIEALKEEFATLVHETAGDIDDLHMKLADVNVKVKTLEAESDQWKSLAKRGRCGD